MRESKDQLTEFYAPMRGMRAEIKAKSDIRVKINAAGETGWAEELKPAQGMPGMVEVDENVWKGYEKLLNYSEEQLKNELVPLYNKMAKYFTEHIGMAEESTIAHYPAFVEFVEVWNRFLKGALPKAVANKLSHAESNLYPLYDDIETNARRLSEELKGNSWLRKTLSRKE